MADFVFNVAKGRVAELYNRVQTNDPAGAELVIVAINTTATDATLRDLDTLALILSNADTAEVTNSGYARIDLTDTDLSAFAPDDANDRVDLDIANQTWSSVGAGSAWTDLIICYDPTGSSAGSALIPLTQHDFAVTPDGSDITAEIAAAGFYRAS